MARPLLLANGGGSLAPSTIQYCVLARPPPSRPRTSAHPVAIHPCARVLIPTPTLVPSTPLPSACPPQRPPFFLPCDPILPLRNPSCPIPSPRPRSPPSPSPFFPSDAPMSSLAHMLWSASCLTRPSRVRTYIRRSGRRRSLPSLPRSAPAPHPVLAPVAPVRHPAHHPFRRPPPETKSKSKLQASMSARPRGYQLQTLRKARGAAPYARTPRRMIQMMCENPAGSFSSSSLGTTTHGRRRPLSRFVASLQIQKPATATATDPGGFCGVHPQCITGPTPFS